MMRIVVGPIRSLCVVGVAALTTVSAPTGGARAQGARTVLILPVEGSSRDAQATRAYTDLHERLMVVARQSGSFQNVINPSFDTVTQDQLQNAVRAGRYDSPVVLQLGKQHNANTLLGAHVGEFTLSNGSVGGTSTFTSSFVVTMSLIDVETRTVVSSESRTIKTCTKKVPMIGCVSLESSPDKAVNNAIASATSFAEDFFAKAVPWAIVDVRETTSDGAPTMVVVRVGQTGSGLRPGSGLVVQRSRRSPFDSTVTLVDQLAMLQVVEVKEGDATCRVTDGTTKLGDAIKQFLNGSQRTPLLVRPASK